MKHPRTPTEIADELLIWFENGKGGMVRLAQRTQPEVTSQMELWFEKGRARINVLAEAIRSLENEA